jgi:hypothetical protein
MVLYEEVTGTNCTDCAQNYPALWNLMRSGDNPDKIVMIKYLYPDTSALAQQDAMDYQHMWDFYFDMFTTIPVGFFNGLVLPEGDNPSSIISNPQDIDDGAMLPPAFDIKISPIWISGNQVQGEVYVKALHNYMGINEVLKIALTETMHFTTAPGSNGVKYYPNLVRKMYPDFDGIDVQDQWTGDETDTFQFSGPIPSYVNMSDTLKLVAWLQDADNRHVQQAAVAYHFPTDEGIGSILKNKDGLKIYPNPVTSELNINLDLVHSSEITFTVFNILGQSIHSEKHMLQTGTNHFSLSTARLLPGIYFLNISTEAGSIQRKFVKG